MQNTTKYRNIFNVGIRKKKERKMKQSSYSKYSKKNKYLANTSEITQ